MTDATNDEARNRSVTSEPMGTSGDMDEARVAEIRGRIRDDETETWRFWSNREIERYHDRKALMAAVDAVLGLHVPFSDDGISPSGTLYNADFPLCTTCGYKRWPCPTVKAATEALGGEL